MGMKFKINTAYQDTATKNKPQKKHQQNNEITVSYIARSLCEAKTCYFKTNKSHKQTALFRFHDTPFYILNIGSNPLLEDLCMV